ncbi:hypothetical protein BD410DRAFT_58786 [Rickenella mellea]|uniref:Uncharacterized protein n=1 Tax=Rickenella mellea TaxID=50990 RepID=A0A4Y7QBG9_9AGAM|nr:hypothetical protein BD410DRAFT_58786 [Rickenella mellea]
MSGSRQHNATPSVASRLQHKLWKPPKHAEQESDRERSRNRAAKITQDLAAQSRKRSSTYPYAVELSSSAVPGPSARVVTQSSSSGRDQQHASSSSTHHQPRPQRVATAPTPLSQGTSQSQATRSNLEVPDSRGYLSRRTQQTPMSSTEQISGGEGSSWSSNRVPVPVGKNNPTTQSAHPAPSAPTATKTMWNMFSQSSRSAGPSKPRDSAQEERAKKEKAREERRAKEERARQERMDEEKARLEYYARAKAEAEYAAQVKKAEKATRAATSSKRVDTPEQKEYDSSPNGQRHRGDDALSTRHGRSGSGSVQPTPLQAISTASQAAASRSANPAPSSSQPYQQPFPSTSAQQSGQVSGRDAAGARHQTTSSSQAFHQAQALASSSAQPSAPVPSRDDTRQSTSNGQAFHQSLATAYSQQTGASSGHDANRHRSVSASAQPPITLPPISSASQAFQNFASRPSAPPLTPATGVSTASQANYASRPAAPGLSSQAGVSAAQANYLAASRNGPAAAVQIASSTANDEQSGGRHRSVSASATTSVQPGVTLPPISVASRAYQQAVSRSTTVPPTSTTQTYQHPAPVAPVQNATDISSTRHNRSDSTSVQPGSTLTAMSTASQVYQQPTSRNASGAPQSSHGYQYPQPSVPVGAAQMTGEVPHTRHVC